MVLVIGTLHEYQRHQDTMADREQVRANFERRLREIIQERSITLIAEEAGDDTAVWEHLKQQDELFGEVAAALGVITGTVDKPVPTVANQIAADSSGQITHVDIRVDPNKFPFVEQRDEAMVMKVVEMLGTTENILVIVGEAHRAGLTMWLKNAGLCVESFSSPDGLAL